LDHLDREVGMKDIRHAVDEDSQWSLPAKWILQAVLPETWCKGILAVRCGVADRELTQVDIARTAVRNDLRVAVVAAG